MNDEFDEQTSILIFFTNKVKLILDQEPRDANMKLLSRCWSDIFYITTKSLKLCEEFIRLGVVDLVIKTHNLITDKGKNYTSLTNALFSVSNIVSIVDLRYQVLNDDLLKIMLEIMTTHKGELSDLACSILVYLVSSDYEVWTTKTFSRSSVLSSIKKMLKDATFYTSTVKYVSLDNEIALMKRDDTPELQHWAIWTTCNLLMHDRKHYKEMLGEDGLGAIAQLKQQHSSVEIQYLAAKAMALCE